MKCTSCGMSVETEESWVEFKCPRCGKAKIIRCEKCRKLMNTYVCPNCGFVGP
ncbi:MAG: RNA-binding protein [Candidatus Aenigmatarchaeota archaeon]|nr:MAG: RNA-binding protein [Candidatus Aenigmarchaeota archaeon]